MDCSAPGDEGLRQRLAACAAGRPDAIAALVGELLPDLSARLPDAAPKAIADAARQALAAAPGFVTGQRAVVVDLLARLVANAMAGASPALPAQEHHGVLLDLDRGDLPHAPLPRTRAWLHLGLLLLAPDEQRGVVAHWQEPEQPARSVGPARRLHRVVSALRRGDGRAALATAAGADAWGATTQWSLVLGAAGTTTDSIVQRRWRELVARYGPPIRAAVRRLLPAHLDADEVADDFFAYLFEHRVLAKAGPERGRFRAYVQAVLRRYLLERRRERGAAAELPASEPAAEPASEAIVRAEEKAWAEHVLKMALAKLLARTPRDGEILLRAYGIPWPGGTTPASPRQTSEEIARALRTTAAAVDQATYRARRLLRQGIAAELAATVASSADRDHELALMEQRLLEAHPGLL